MAETLRRAALPDFAGTATVNLGLLPVVAEYAGRGGYVEREEVSSSGDLDLMVMPELVSSEVPPSESINVWPDEAAESAFLAESGGAAVTTAPAARVLLKSESQSEPAKPLPSLDELVQRIPSETRELLDELFRAKFTTVRRVKASDLKPEML